MQEHRGVQAVSECEEQEGEAGKDKAKCIDDMCGCHNIVPPFT